MRRENGRRKGGGNGGRRYQTLLPPWATRLYSADAPGAAGRELDDEINDFVQYMTLGEAEHAARRSIRDRIGEVVSDLWPGATTEVSSDVDITVMGAPSDLKDVVPALGGGLRAAGFDVHEVLNTKVPIAKFHDPATGLQGDVSFNVSSAVPSAVNVRRLLKEFPKARPLILVLKSFLRLKDANNPYTGGLSSYSLYLMVFSFLQLRYGRSTREVGESSDASSDGISSDQRTTESAGKETAETTDDEPCTAAASDDGTASDQRTERESAATTEKSESVDGEGCSHSGVGEALLEFLEYFGTEGQFDHSELAISVQDGGRLLRKSAPSQLLSIEDPIDPTNDVAKGTFRIRDCRTLFRMGAMTLREYRFDQTKRRKREPVPGTRLLSMLGRDPRLTHVLHGGRTAVMPPAPSPEQLVGLQMLPNGWIGREAWWGGMCPVVPPAVGVPLGYPLPLPFHHGVWPADAHRQQVAPAPERRRSNRAGCGPGLRLVPKRHPQKTELAADSSSPRVCE
eukprot:TRINITY_DN5689_c0_g1_i3.p1 TRINITY_DN5689_c0_g1~~TRINITY_DN5689_c0_g1_i3.p1  ORF type:complete len:575 (+),score=174.60 TRINITY_DN5689_c0_g1_i3:195-1727(+)